ncbi:MAG: alpha/beta hydrolase, partial [Synergistaceae bacterium]|nr:alpha/beta hydrolase [Synergistaceae bacterium]
MEKKMHLEGIDVGYYDRRPEERHAEGRGLQKREPEKPAVLFLHGWGCDFSVFRSCLDRVTDRRVCALDLPGFGGSQEPPVAWGVDDYADFVAAFLKKLEIRQVTLIGHSNGGRIVIKLAAGKTLPFRIDKIVLVDSAGVKPNRSVRQSFRLGLYKCVKKVLSFSAAKKFFPGALEAWRRRIGSAD